MKKLMQLLSLNLFVLMLVASCTGTTGQGFHEGEGELVEGENKEEDIPMAEVVVEATPTKTSKEVLEEIIQELELEKKTIKKLRKKSPNNLIIWAAENKVAVLVDALLKEGLVLTHQNITS